MRTGIEITSEKNPYFREIYSLGFDEVVIDESSNIVRLLNYSDKTYKEIKKNSLFNLCNPFSIKKRINYVTEEMHLWISEADGSAKKFRDIINKSPIIKTKY